MSFFPSSHGFIDTMTTQPYQNEMLLVFNNVASSESCKVPAHVLTQTLDGLQRLFHLLALQHEKKDTGKRDRADKTIIRKYSVLCSPPQKGSVVLSVQIGDPFSDLFASNDIGHVYRNFCGIVRSILENRISDLYKLLPDRIRRTRILKTFDSIVPKRNSGVALSIQGIDGTEILNSRQFHTAYTECFPRSEERHSTLTVTGRLSEIDFDERKITLIYPETNRELECFYDDTVEDMLLQNPRELIQVTGIVTFDEDDRPKKIVEVEDIREVDLSPFRVDEIEFDNKILRFRNPMILNPRLDESQQLICLSEPRLGIDVFAYSRDELEKELGEQITFLWEDFANCDDAEMTAQAVELKKHLLESISFVEGAIDAKR